VNDSGRAIERFHLGSYTESGGLGIAGGRVDATTGQPIIERWHAEIDQPSWVEGTPDGTTLYAVSELTPDGRVHALRIGGAGELTPLNSRPTGAEPAHLSIHPGGEFLFVSLYGGGGVAVHPLAADGSIGPSSDYRRHAADDSAGTAAHAHQVVVDSSGRYLLAVDLGLDSVFSYQLDVASGRLVEVGRTAFESGSGPRHLAVHPTEGYVYVLSELHSTVTVCGWADGRLAPGQVCATVLDLPKLDLPKSDAEPENYPAEIVASPDGRFLYASNRGPNTIAVFAIEDGGARVRLLATPDCGGDWPRHLALSATGDWLYSANERSGDLTWFRVDRSTGLLGPVQGRVPAPGVTQLHFA
jgi:6-phosphogluconolactonase